MILFQNWNIEYIGGLFARQYDNLSRALEVTGVPEGYDWNMMVQVGENFDILSLSPMEGGVGVVLTANQLSIAGYYKLQLVGTLRSDGVTKRHTNVLQVYVPGSLSGDANWPTVPSEFSQVEANIRELNSHPPIPGDNGYWMIWDLESHGYMESEFPLPEAPAGPAGEDGTTFTPSVSASGILSWTNNGGLENPAPVDIRGPAGKDGEQGPAGEDGLGVPAATAEDAGKVPVVQADGSYGLGSMIPAPETAEVGQTIVVKAVDENGKPTEWEAADMASGGGSVGGIHLIARVVTEANAASIEVTGLSTNAEVLSLRIYNPGSNCSGGFAITVNGVRKLGYTGTIAGSSVTLAAVRAWLYRDSGKLHGRARMANDGTNTYEWPEMEEITSIAIDSPYNDGTTKYFQAGTIFEIYEGVYPNVS